MNPLIPSLVFIAAPACAMESWGIPDLSQRDKQEHFAAGAVIGAGVTALCPGKPWQRVAAAVAASVIAGVAKEAYDRRHPHTHDCDPKDALATVAGGAAGSLCITMTWRF